MVAEQRDHEPRVVVIEPGDELADVLDRVNDGPLVLRRGGVRYRIERQDDGLIYPRNPRGLREALRRSAGAFARIDTEQLKRDPREQGERDSVGRPAE